MGVLAPRLGRGADVRVTYPGDPGPVLEAASSGEMTAAVAIAPPAGLLVGVLCGANAGLLVHHLISGSAGVWLAAGTGVITGVVCGVLAGVLCGVLVWFLGELFTMLGEALSRAMVACDAGSVVADAGVGGGARRWS